MENLQPEEFYFNKEGLLVLTAKYLLDRGYCCGNGCLHCPYEKTESEKIQSTKTDGFDGSNAAH